MVSDLKLHEKFIAANHFFIAFTYQKLQANESAIFDISTVWEPKIQRLAVSDLVNRLK
jgi:hypothetical protein